MGLIDEIREQPEAVKRLVQAQGETVAAIAEQLKAREIDYVYLAARGTSDNAGKYAQYLFGAVNQLPMALAAPSLFSLYQQPPDLRHALVVGISQSGRSPDIVSVLDEARQQGAASLAITNSPYSPMADAAEFVLDICAGDEKAVAATKTYTNTLAAIVMLSAALAGDTGMLDQLARVPGWMAEMLAAEEEIADHAQHFAKMGKCIVLGRGYNFSTACEWALKLKELTWVMAESYSSADFLHGPVAIIHEGFPVFGVVPGGMTSPFLVELLEHLRVERNATVFTISDQEEILQQSNFGFRLPTGIPEWISPLVTILPGQLFAYHLTRLKGLDPDHPLGLTKVTKTI